MNSATFAFVLTHVAIVPWRSLASAQVVSIPNEPTCSRCTITTEVIATVGTADGPGALGAVPGIEGDANGRYWVFNGPEAPLVFASTGQFLTRVGRTGSGPGEFRMPYTVWSLPGDSVAVIEGGGRVSVFDPALKFVRNFMIPILDPLGTLILDWPKRIVVNGQIRTSDRLGWPFHALDVSGQVTRITRSFGPGDGKVLPGSQGRLAMRHQLARASSGAYWSAAAYTYTVSRWDSNDELVTTFERRPVWFAQPSDGLPGGPEKPASPRLLGAREAPDGLLWIYVLVPAPTYARAWRQVAADLKRGVTEIPASKIDYEFLYNTRVEVIDPNSRRVVTSTLLDGPVRAVMPNGLIAIPNTTPDGWIQIRIVRLRLTR